MVWFDRPTARTHRAATRRVGDQAITSPGRCALILSLTAQVDPNDPQSPTNKDFYANLKAQTWWEVARRFRNTFNAVEKGEVYADTDLIAISSEMEHLDSLIDELATPRKDVDNAGRSKVESKKDLAKRDVASPNKADAFVMAFAPVEATPSVQAFLSKSARAKLKGNR